jgi:hypothetical protein
MRKQVKLIHYIFTKLRFLRLTTRIYIYFDKSKGEFISMPKQNAMKLYREPEHKHTYILTSAFSESVMSFHAVPVVTLLCRRLHKPWHKSVKTDVSQSLLVNCPHPQAIMLFADWFWLSRSEKSAGRKWVSYI